MAQKFKAGDRVRMFTKRGGWVVRTARGLRALFPQDGQAHFLTYCEPDETGPLGLGYLGRCMECENEHRSGDPLCINCGFDGLTPPPYPAWVVEWMAKHQEERHG